MSPSRWHPPRKNNTDALYLGDQHCLVRNSVGFCFYFSFLPYCQLLIGINDSVIYIIPNPGVLFSKLLRDSVFHFYKVDQMSTMNFPFETNLGAHAGVRTPKIEYSNQS